MMKNINLKLKTKIYILESMPWQQGNLLHNGLEEEEPCDETLTTQKRLKAQWYVPVHNEIFNVQLNISFFPKINHCFYHQSSMIELHSRGVFCKIS